MSRLLDAALVVLALALAAAPARAQVEEEQTPALHGFVSPGAMKSTANNYLSSSHRGSVELTEAAVNVTESLGSTLRVGMQFFADQIGRAGGFDTRFDWYYLDWHRFDWLSLRAGRVKLPFGLYNELADYDPGRLTILLPQSVYPLVDRDFLLAATGLDLYGRRTLAAFGALDYSLVGGTIFVPVPAGSPPDTRFDVPWIADARLIWETPVPGLRLAGSALAGELDEDATLPGQTTPTHAELHALFWIASAEYVRDRFTFAAEYSRWRSRVTVVPPFAGLPNGTTVSERYYALASWRFTDAFEAGLYYAATYPDVDHRTGAGQFQDDAALSLRYDLSLHWLVKLETHYIHGTAALDPSLNGGTPVAALTQDWGLVLVRTAAYF